MHQRPWNSSAKPASGPECSVPATGWPGTKCTPLRQLRAEVADHRLLDRADIGDDRARLARSARSPRRSRHRRRAACRSRRGRRRRPPRPASSWTLSTKPQLHRLVAGAPGCAARPAIWPARPLAPHARGPATSRSARCRSAPRGRTAARSSRALPPCRRSSRRSRPAPTAAWHLRRRVPMVMRRQSGRP